MDYFRYQGSKAYCEGVPLERIAAKAGTPAYVYSGATLDRHVNKLRDAFRRYPTLPCYAVKANHNLAVLKRIFSSGFGADVVSGGELSRALRSGAKAQEIVFSGVGKQEHEISQALGTGILSFNVESAGELRRIRRVAKKLKRAAPISLRINPNIDAKTNPYIATGLYKTKFGIDETAAKALIREIGQDPHLNLIGLACHIGSQITTLAPFRRAVARMARLAAELIDSGAKLKILNLGGGVGIRYKGESPPSLAKYADSLIRAVRPTGLRLVIEPGRIIVGNCGILLTRVIDVKQTRRKTFVIVDAAMNDLLRPSMYGSYHEILPALRSRGKGFKKSDVVGPICETGDFLALDRNLPALKPGDLLFVRGCGAYSATMASNYNSRPRAPEILVQGNRIRIVRKRESAAELWKHESI